MPSQHFTIQKGVLRWLSNSEVFFDHILLKMSIFCQFFLLSQEFWKLQLAIGYEFKSGYGFYYAFKKYLLCPLPCFHQDCMYLLYLLLISYIPLFYYIPSRFVNVRLFEGFFGEVFYLPLWIIMFYPFFLHKFIEGQFLTVVCRIPSTSSYYLHTWATNKVLLLNHIPWYKKILGLLRKNLHALKELP